jgi:hypothetical protein
MLPQRRLRFRASYAATVRDPFRETASDILISVDDMDNRLQHILTVSPFPRRHNNNNQL